MNPLEKAVAGYVAYPPGDRPICPPAIWVVGPDPQIGLGTNPANPFDGMTVTQWSDDR